MSVGVVACVESKGKATFPNGVACGIGSHGFDGTWNGTDPGAFGTDSARTSHYRKELSQILKRRIVACKEKCMVRGSQVHPQSAGLSQARAHSTRNTTAPSQFRGRNRKARRAAREPKKASKSKNRHGPTESDNKCRQNLYKIMVL